jgi:hypothetical protein
MTTFTDEQFALVQRRIAGNLPLEKRAAFFNG